MSRTYKRKNALWYFWLYRQDYVFYDGFSTGTTVQYVGKKLKKEKAKFHADNHGGKWNPGKSFVTMVKRGNKAKYRQKVRNFMAGRTEDIIDSFPVRNAKWDYW
jgi:hypothetical protein